MSAGPSVGGTRLSTHDQANDIAGALTRLHAAGWSIGDTAFFDAEHGTIVYVVIGTNGENQIRAEGRTAFDAWREALGQAAQVGMLPDWPPQAVG
jgi:hypothetical protein